MDKAIVVYLYNYILCRNKKKSKIKRVKYRYRNDTHNLDECQCNY